MNKVSMVRSVIAKCDDMLVGKKALTFVAVCDAELSSEEINRYVLEQTRVCGLYVNNYVLFDPMPEWQANELLLSLGIEPNRLITAGDHDEGR